MKKKVTQPFYSKIQLFGEYGVIYNAMGLYIPLKKYAGNFSFQVKRLTQQATTSHIQLRQYADYITHLMKQGKASFHLDTNALLNDIKQGLIFESTIPRGSGLGSSGALCAALYDRYTIDKIPRCVHFTDNLILRLKTIFSQMEAYFHGKSSGLDPLICYLNRPFIINPKATLSPIHLAKTNISKKYTIFLLNTGTTASTQSYVKFFLDQCKKLPFLENIVHKFIPTNNHCIDAFLQGDSSTFFTRLQSLSSYTITYLKQMVPKKLINLWQQGLETQAYYLKLCGAGGGGFVLGFTDQFSKTSALLKDYPITVVQEF